MLSTRSSLLLPIVTVLALAPVGVVQAHGGTAKVSISSNALVENEGKTTVKLSCSEGTGKCKGEYEVYSKGKVQVGQQSKPIAVIAARAYNGDPARLMKLKPKLTKDALTALTYGSFEVVIEVRPAGSDKKIKKTVTLNP